MKDNKALERALASRYVGSLLHEVDEYLKRLKRSCETNREIRAKLDEERHAFEEKNSRETEKLIKDRKNFDEERVQAIRKARTKETAKTAINRSNKLSPDTNKTEIRALKEKIEEIRAETKKKSSEMQLTLSNTIKENKTIRKELREAKKSIEELEEKLSFFSHTEQIVSELIDADFFFWTTNTSINHITEIWNTEGRNNNRTVAKLDGCI